MSPLSAALAFFRETLIEDGGKASFGRTYSLPFFFTAWAIGTAAGVRNVVQGGSVFDEVAVLAGIGFALYTGSKALTITQGRIAVGKAAQSPTPPPAG